MKNKILKILTGIILIGVMLIPTTNINAEAPLPPGIPLMLICQTSPTTYNLPATIKISGNTYETITDYKGMFYLPINGKVGDIIEISITGKEYYFEYVNIYTTQALYITLPIEGINPMIEIEKFVPAIKYYSTKNLTFIEKIILQLQNLKEIYLLISGTS